MNPEGERRYLRNQGIITGPYAIATIRERQRSGRLPEVVEISTDKRHWELLLPEPSTQEEPPSVGLPEASAPEAAEPAPRAFFPLTRFHCGAALLGQLWNLPFYRIVLQTAPRQWRLAGSWWLWGFVMVVWELALAGFGGKFSLPAVHWPFWMFLLPGLVVDLGVLTLLIAAREERQTQDYSEALPRAAALMAAFFGAAALLTGILPPFGSTGIGAWCRRGLALYVGICAVGNWIAGVRQIGERELAWRPERSLYGSAALLLGQCGVLWGIFRIAAIF